MIDRFLLTLTNEAFARPFRYELVPGERTVVGNNMLSADCSVPDAAMSRQDASLQFHDGGFLLRDIYYDARPEESPYSENHYDNDPPDPTPVLLGQVMRWGNTESVISRFSAAPLDDVFVPGSLEASDGWILFGRRRDAEHGRWPAFRRNSNGAIERALVTGVHTGRVPSKYGGARWKGRDPKLDYLVRPAADGIFLRRFAAAVRTSLPDLSALGALVCAIPGVDRYSAASDLVVTWDGRVMRMWPCDPTPSSGDDIFDVVPTGQPRPEVAATLPPARIAELVRSLFADEWRVELELREQLASLDEKGVRWLLERNQRTP